MDTNFRHSVKQWWLSLISGIIFVGIGVWVLAAPIASYLALSTLFIVGFAVVGLLGVFYALNNRKRLKHWEWSLMGGLIDLFIAVLLITTPDISLKILPIYVGFLLLFRSVIGIGFSTHLYYIGVRSWALVLLLSILGVIFSSLMIWNPVFGGFSLIIYTAIALLATGMSQIGISLGLKRLNKRLKK